MATQQEAKDTTAVTFASLGLDEVLCKACEGLGYKQPTLIQKEALPHGLQGRDVIGLAETGSGKTASFALPILQSLLHAEGNRAFYALVLAPTRFANRLKVSVQASGSNATLKNHTEINITAVITGGIDMMSQSIALSKKPNVIIATPGRIIDHLENTKGFNLRSLKFLVMDEADRILNMDFEKELLRVIPKERTTFLFSATMTSKVAKLQRASLHNPVKVEVSTKYKTADSLIQRYQFIPHKHKDSYCAHVVQELQGNSFMIFCSTCNSAQRLTLILRDLGLQAVCLHGKMTQPKRLGALAKFQAKATAILVATDVASRGLDIPHVDVVINYDIPMHSKDYIHRVGRTARAGRAGRAITFVTQYDVELYQRIEELLGTKLEQYPCDEAQIRFLLTRQVLQLQERVSEAQRKAAMIMKSMEEDDKSSKKRHAEDTEDQEGGRKKSFHKGGKSFKGRAK